MDQRYQGPAYFRVSPAQRRGSGQPKWVIPIVVFLLVVVFIWMAWNYQGFVPTNEPVETPLVTALAQSFAATPSPSATLAPTNTFHIIEPDQTTSVLDPSSSGDLIFAARAGGYSHLWLYRPGELTPVQITYGNWDNRDPAISPDGRQIAFASRQNGNWDLYLLDIATRETRRLTATLGYEGRPSWSPDGQWLTYEAYYEGNFDIWLLPVRGDGDAIRLTTHPAVDHSPVWSADGRKIVFVSNRDGNFDLYLADLDRNEDRFSNLTRTPNATESDPAIASDGARVAYCSKENGMSWIMLLDLRAPDQPPTKVGQGVLPAWSGDDEALAAVQAHAYQAYVVGYSIGGRKLPALGISVNGAIAGLDWYAKGDLLPIPLAVGGAFPVDPLYETILSEPQALEGRLSLVPLQNVSAPRPVLSDAVNEAFNALRERVSAELGWDFLAILDYAFVGINDAMPPGFAYNDWLYTGRGFAISESIARAGWVEVFREDISGETHWRLYVRTRFQDGSLGQPLRDYPWDFRPRFEGDAYDYDQGGAYKDVIPEGYYIDFTSLAADFGFFRQSALPNWRTFYAGTRYAEFAKMDGLRWEEAMRQLYPDSAIQTPTPFCTPTPTATRTPWPTATSWWHKWQTPTATSTASPLPTSTP